MDQTIHDLKLLLSKNKEAISWDSYFSGLSLLIASRSSCHRLHVGCVIVRDKRILSTGYNGFLPGLPHISIVRDGHEQGTVHAEQNAISFAAKTGVSLDGGTAYITHYPCINCCKLLLSVGIKEIKYIDDYKNDPLVQTLFLQSGVSVHHLGKIESYPYHGSNREKKNKKENE